VGTFLGRTVVNLPGCPTHPDWIIGTLASVLGGAMPSLDQNKRPVSYYPAKVIHQRCPRRDREKADRFGQPGLCLKELGCRGPSAHADCDLRGWNNQQNWCIGADGLCIGCTEPGFPAFPLHRSGEGDEVDDLVAANVACVSADTPPSGSEPVPPGSLNHQLFIPSVLNR
jgi:Ni,Fe-hydrogenase I small subunit